MPGRPKGAKNKPKPLGSVKAGLEDLLNDAYVRSKVVSNDREKREWMKVYFYGIQTLAQYEGKIPGPIGETIAALKDLYGVKEGSQ